MYVGEGLDKIQEGDAMESVDIGWKPSGKLWVVLCFYSHPLLREYPNIIAVY